MTTETTPRSEFMGKMTSAARSHYVDLPFHNFEHATHVAKLAKKMAQRAKGIMPSLELAIDDEVVEVAALWKDAGRQEIGRPIGNYAAELFRSAARLIDRDKKDRFMVMTSEAIVTSTLGRRNGAPNRNAIPVFGASVAHMWAKYEDFVHFQNLAYDEHGALNNLDRKSKAMTKSEWIQGVLVDEVEGAAGRVEAEFPLIGIANAQDFAGKMIDNVVLYHKRNR